MILSSSRLASTTSSSSPSQQQQQKQPPSPSSSGNAAGSLSTLKFHLDSEAALSAFAVSLERNQKLTQLVASVTARENVSEKITPESLMEIFFTPSGAPIATSTIGPLLELGKEKELPQIRKAAIAVCKKLLQGKKLPDSVAAAAFTVLCADAEWLKFAAEEVEKELPTNPKIVDNFYESFKHLTMSFIIPSLVMDADRVCVPRASQTVAALLCLLEQIELVSPTTTTETRSGPSSQSGNNNNSNNVKSSLHHAVRVRTEIALEQCFDQLWGFELERLAIALTAKDDRKKNLITTGGNVIPLHSQSHVFMYVFGRMWERSLFRLFENQMRVNGMKSLGRFHSTYFSSKFHQTLALWCERLEKELALRDDLTQKKKRLEEKQQLRENLLEQLEEERKFPDAHDLAVRGLRGDTSTESRVKAADDHLDRLHRDVALLEKSVTSTAFLIDESSTGLEIANLISISIALVKQSSSTLIKTHPLMSFGSLKKSSDSSVDGGLADILEGSDADDKNDGGNKSKDETATQETESSNTKNNNNSKKNQNVAQLIAQNKILQKPFQIPKHFPMGWTIVVKHTLLRQLRAAFPTSSESSTSTTSSSPPTSTTTMTDQQIIDQVVNFVQPLLDATSRLDFPTATGQVEQGLKEALVQLYKRHPKIHILVAQLRKESNVELKKSLLMQKLKKGTAAANDKEATTVESATETMKTATSTTIATTQVTPLFKTRAEHMLTEHARESLITRFNRLPSSIAALSSLIHDLPLMSSDGALYGAVMASFERVGRHLREPQQLQQKPSDQSGELKSEERENESKIKTTTTTTATVDDKIDHNFLSNDSSQAIILLHVTTWLKAVEFETRYTAWRERLAVEEILYQQLLGSKTEESTSTPTSTPTSSLLKNVPPDFMSRPLTFFQKAASTDKTLSFSFLRCARAVTLIDHSLLAGHKAKDAQAKEYHARLWLRLASFGLIDYTTCEVPDPKYFLLMMSEEELPSQDPSSSTSSATTNKTIKTNRLFNSHAPTIPSVNDIMIEASAAPCLQLMTEMARHKKLSVKSKMLHDAKCAVLCRMLKHCERLQFPKYLSGEEALRDCYEKEIRPSSSSSAATPATETVIRQELSDLLLLYSPPSSQTDSPADSSGAAVAPSSPKISRRRTLDSYYNDAAAVFIPEIKANNAVLTDGIGAPSASMWRILANGIAMIAVEGGVEKEDSVIRRFVEDLGMFKSQEEVFDLMAHGLTCCLAQIYLVESRAPREFQLARVLLYIASMSKAHDGIARAFVKNENFGKLYLKTIQTCIRNHSRPFQHHHHHKHYNQQQQHRTNNTNNVINNSTATISSSPSVTPMMAMRPQLDSDGNDASDSGGSEFQIRALIALASTSPIVTSAESVISAAAKREILDPFRDNLARGTFPPSSWRSDDVAAIFVAVCSIPELLSFATNSFFDRVAQRLDDFKQSELQSMYAVLKSSSASMSGLSAALVEGIKQRLVVGDGGESDTTAGDSLAKNTTAAELKSTWETGEASNDSASGEGQISTSDQEVSIASLIAQVNLPKHASDAAKIQLIRKISNSTSDDDLSAADLLQCLRASDKQGPGLVLRNAIRARILSNLRDRSSSSSKNRNFPAFVSKMMVGMTAKVSNVNNNNNNSSDRSRRESFITTRNQTLVELARTMSTHFFGDSEIWNEWNQWILKDWIEKKFKKESGGDFVVDGDNNHDDQSKVAQDDVWYLSRSDRQALTAVQYVAGIEV